MSKNLKDTAAMRLMNNMGAGVNEHNRHNEHNVNYAHNEHIDDNEHNAQSVHIVHTDHKEQSARTEQNEQERKNKHFHLLMHPSTADRLAKIATMKRTSVNDLINTVLRNYTETEQETIGKYDETFS